ncbi:redoxin domain-containing protein [Natronoglycomyces albus]|uniref:Redoxin domain-containing protein n=1 Tax=Natronoglycomyces albus TaxID=2811108 RepID=A0A895XNU4_9ACTN|nr:redoxin domain-containing protein [Natronoglycomyces albus]QSB05213.1 redoxin domain-containing protein [Natronoglycomyces albus]
MNRIGKLTLAALVGGALMLAGCGTGSEESNGDTATNDHADSNGDSGQGSISPNLRFTAETLAGEEFSGESLAGTPTVLWFWAEWCPKCIAQAPELNQQVSEYSDQVDFVGVSGLSQDVNGMEDFVENTGTDGFTHLADTEGEVWGIFGIFEQSIFVVLDAEGNVVVSSEGDPAALGGHLDDLL